MIALQRRREVAQEMRTWLDDDDVFDQAAAAAGGPERAWQSLLEANPWVLGVGLGGQLLTAGEPGQLEQTVVGRSIRTVGKRADALLQTVGIVRSLVFAEIKHHRTKLLGDEYRAGCGGPSEQLSGTVVQVQQTAHLAAQELGDYVQDQAGTGELLPSGTFLLQPRSYVIGGSLAELVGPSGGALRDHVRSFELFRRNLQEPETLTFDELVARAPVGLGCGGSCRRRLKGDCGSDGHQVRSAAMRRCRSVFTNFGARLPTSSYAAQRVQALGASCV